MSVQRCVILAFFALVLAACSSGNVRRVSEPTASIQQLTVRANGDWAIDLRLQNYSSIAMQFDRIMLELSVGNQIAGTLDQTIDLSIGPESADVVQVSLRPNSLAILTVADALTGRHALPYQLKGQSWATPDEKKQRQFTIDTHSALSPAPGLDGVLR